MLYRALLTLLALQESPTFQASVNLVHVEVEVRQNQRLIEGPTKEDFRITDNGEVRPVLYLGNQEEPLDITLLLDTSASMEPVMEQVAAAARAALAQLRGGDRIAVMALDEDPDLLVDFISDFEAAYRVR